MDAEPEKHISNGEEAEGAKSSKTKKYLGSMAVYYCTFAFGVAFTFLGPTTIDFSRKFDTSVGYVSTVFSIMTASYLVGAICNGVLTRFIPRQMVVLGLLSIGTTVLFIIPHVSTIGIFFMLGSFLGIFAGGYDTAQVAWIIEIWRHDAPPYILIQHFMYSLGTVVPPLLLAPFLHGDEDSDDNNCTSVTTAAPWGSSTTESPTLKDDMWIPFSVAGCIVGLGIIVQCAFYFFVLRPANKKAAKIEKPAASASSEGKKKFEFPPRREMTLVALSACCISSYQGMEICTLQYLPTFSYYSLRELCFTEAQGANVLFGLTLAFCVFRFIGIFVVLKRPPHQIIFVNLALLVIGNVILVLFKVLPGDQETWLWAGSVTLGAALSTTFPAYFAYIEKYLFITDTVAALILVCGGALSAIYPIIIGSAVQYTPNVMIYVNFFSCAVLITAFIATFRITYLQEQRENKEKILEGNQISNSSGNNNEVTLGTEKDKKF